MAGNEDGSVMTNARQQTPCTYDEATETAHTLTSDVATPAGTRRTGEDQVSGDYLVPAQSVCPAPHKWTERNIASYLARVIFERRHLVMVPNCQWPGSECDLLVVTNNLRMIDVEIKISRADLKADAKKDKWFHHWDFRIDGPYYQGCAQNRRRREWPARVWKHYYCLPKAIWKPDLYDRMNANSGLLLIQDRADGILVTCERRAKPDTKADKINAENVMDIARLASLRMWDAYETLDARVRDYESLKRMAA